MSIPSPTQGNGKERWSCFRGRAPETGISDYCMSRREAGTSHRIQRISGLNHELEIGCSVERTVIEVCLETW
jgi:hypothetical protein